MRLGFALGLIALISSAACGSGPPKVVIYNDLSFDAAIFFCGHSATVTEDPKIVEHGHSATIRPRGDCPITGPASRKSGNPGPYVGCLEIPVVEGTEPPRLRMSEANPDVAEKDCE
jgi:hypothetical protein